MPSASHAKWLGERRSKLLEIRAAHTAIGGTGPGRRTATQQINQAYAVLLMAQFQGFCRDLHTEAVERLSTAISSHVVASIFQWNLMAGRRLAAGNANPGNLGSDFGRLGMSLWDSVYTHDARNQRRREKLDELAAWRNAIGHQDFTAPCLGGTSLTLSRVESWFGACQGLAASFDVVVADHVAALIGRQPW